jgi:glutamate-5-semialdehyde dehydrogenase
LLVTVFAHFFTRHDAMTIEAEIRELAAKAKAAAPAVANLSTREKNAWLLRAAERLEAAKERILAANREDMRDAEAKGVAAPMVKRLDLAAGKWADMLDGLRQVAQLPDPVGEITEMRVRPNGLRVGRMRIPLGVIGIIYESRPNVTVDAAALCVKAGNAVILRGGSEAIRSNLALAEELRGAARDTGLPEAAVTVVATTDRAAIDQLVKLDQHIDLIIPRGGNALIQRVLDGARVPVI